MELTRREICPCHREARQPRSLKDASTLQMSRCLEASSQTNIMLKRKKVKSLRKSKSELRCRCMCKCNPNPNPNP